MHVVERRAIEVTTADAPSFAAAGDVYSLRFTVRNRGNAADTVSVNATSSARSRSISMCRARRSRRAKRSTVIARVSSQIVGRRSVEDVVELTASGNMPAESHTSASSNVLIVPKTTGNTTLATVPAELTIRGARAGTGVSPLALTGAGPIAPGSATTMDFAFRLPAGPPTVFGERDEYRLDIANDKYTVRLGDGSHAFSPLSGSAIRGLVQKCSAAASSGAGARTSPRTGGRRTVRPKPRRSRSASLPVTSPRFRRWSSAVDRRRGRRPSKAALTLARNTVLDVEASKSDSAGVVGFAHRADLSGQSSWMTYDAGWLRGTPTFSGVARGNEYQACVAECASGGPVSFGVTAGDYASTSLAGTDTGDRSRSRSMFFEATTLDGTSLSFERLVQQTDGATPFESFQHTVRLRGHERVGRFDFRGGLGHHIVATSVMTKRSFESFDAGDPHGRRPAWWYRRLRGAQQRRRAAERRGAGSRARRGDQSASAPRTSALRERIDDAGSPSHVTSLSQADITLSKRSRTA